jgi:pimeloyl-ACP methyl ester carboxylesterase
LVKSWSGLLDALAGVVRNTAPASLSMRAGSILALGPHGFHRVAYTDWGAGPPVLCVHGLTRNGRDFDRLAAALARSRRVVCPDVVGRGRSDRLAQPEDYGYPLYLSDMTALIARLGVTEVDWIGTSMGGLIGMMLAAQPNTPIRRLVLNDVGPLVPAAALRRLATYVGEDPRFETLAELEAYLRKVHAPFGPLSDADWAHLAAHGHRALEDGGFGLAYDPAIARALNGALFDVDLWSIWEQVRHPVLVLRGADSDLLLPETAAQMTRRGPGATLIEFPGVGHAPALTAPEQIAAIREWLDSTP